jgi:hypothetical protein
MSFQKSRTFHNIPRDSCISFTQNWGFQGQQKKNYFENFSIIINTICAEKAAIVSKGNLAHFH